jgi:valyl-tRNA synthetase
MKPLAAPAIEAVKDGRITFIPDRYTRIYLDWMEKIQPWCISRQLWWGHRIPVWWAEDRRYTAARSAEDAARNLGVPAESLRQDEDVLDTWFSSALWPHAVLGWPRDTPDLDFWYPTNLLSTAQEIIYLWVARMIMTGLDFMGEIPFSDVYIHATVLDEKGARMSKSKGNGVDPLDMIDRYGADALRFYLLQNAGKNQDIKFREDSVRLAGTFCNKLWNASRFVLSNLDENTTGQFDETKLAPMDRWILSRLSETVGTVNANLATYDMDDAMAAIYRFLWSEFCDWYVEMVKPRLRAEGDDKATAQNVLAFVLETTLRLMHPMIPFITEELWQAAPHQGDTIMTAPYPTADNLRARRDEDAEAQMRIVEEAVRGFRNLRAEVKLDPARRLRGAAAAADAQAALALNGASQAIVDLARLSEFEVRESAPSGDGQWVGSPVAGSEVFLEIGEALDVPKEKERIAKELEQTAKELAGIQGRLNNPQFLEKAAPAVVEKARAQAAELEEKREKLEARRTMLGG